MIRRVSKGASRTDPLGDRKCRTSNVPGGRTQSLVASKSKRRPAASATYRRVRTPGCHSGKFTSYSWSPASGVWSRTAAKKDRPERRRPVRHPRKGQPMRNYRIGVVMVVIALAGLSFSVEMARRESPTTKFMRQRLHGERDRLLARARRRRSSQCPRLLHGRHH